MMRYCCICHSGMTRNPQHPICDLCLGEARPLKIRRGHLSKRYWQRFWFELTDAANMALFFVLAWLATLIGLLVLLVAFPFILIRLIVVNELRRRTPRS